VRRFGTLAWVVPPIAAICLLEPASGFADVSRAQEIRAEVIRALNEGIQAYKEGRVKDSIPLLEKAADIALNSFRSYYYLGLALKADRQYRRALEPLEVALELDPVSLQARVARADCLLKLGDPTEALAEYHRALSIQQDYAPAHDGLGRAAEASGDEEKAIEHFRKAIDLNPGFPDSSLNLGDLYMRRGRYNEAIDLFLNAIQVRPDFAAAYNRLGVAYSRQRLGNEAIAALRKAEDLEQGNPWHPVTIGRIFLDMDNLVQAEREFDKAMSLDPDYLEAYMANALLLRRKGRLQDAREILLKGLVRESEDPRARKQAEELLDQVDGEIARFAEIEQRLADGERAPEDLIEMARLQSDLGDHPEATRLLREAEQAQAEPSAAVLRLLGYTALRAEMYQEAADALQKLTEIVPDDAAALVNLGLARTGLGQSEAAARALREASRLRPGDPRPLVYLGNLQVMTGDRAGAIESLRASLPLAEEGSLQRQRVERLLRALETRESGS